MAKLNALYEIHKKINGWEDSKPKTLEQKMKDNDELFIDDVIF